MNTEQEVTGGVVVLEGALLVEDAAFVDEPAAEEPMLQAEAVSLRFLLLR